MNKEEAQELPKPKTNPLFKGMPKYLKEPANFEDIQRQVYNSMKTDCFHSELHEMAVCKKCTLKMIERRALLKKLGFKGPDQYYAWREVHQTIRQKMPLVDWKAKEYKMPHE